MALVGPFQLGVFYDSMMLSPELHISVHKPLWMDVPSCWCHSAAPWARGFTGLCFHMSRTLLKSSQILLCHKLFQLRKYAIIPLITFYFDERSRLFFFLLSFLFLNVCCIGLGEPSFPFFAYFGISHVSAQRRAQGPAGAHAPLGSGFGVPGTGGAMQAGLCWLSPAPAFPAWEVPHALKGLGSCCKIPPLAPSGSSERWAGDLYFVDYNGNQPQTQIQRARFNQTHVLFERDKISAFYTPIYWCVPG